MSGFASKANGLMRAATNATLAEASVDLNAEVVAATPKGPSGNAADGWQFNRDPGQVDFFRGEALILQNNVPYAKKLEEGSSKQAPGGMLAPSLEKLPEIVEHIASRKGAANG